MIRICYSVKNMRKYWNDNAELVKQQSIELIHIAYAHGDRKRVLSTIKL